MAGTRTTLCTKAVLFIVMDGGTSSSKNHISFPRRVSDPINVLSPICHFILLAVFLFNFHMNTQNIFLTRTKIFTVNEDTHFEVFFRRPPKI